MLILGNYKDNNDTATTTANKSMGLTSVQFNLVETKATQPSWSLGLSELGNVAFNLRLATLNTRNQIFGHCKHIQDAFRAASW